MGVRTMKNKNGVTTYRAEKKFRNKRHSKTFKTQEAALAWIEKLEKKLRTFHTGSNKKNPRMTVRQAMARLVALEIKKKWDPRTIAAYLETIPHLEAIMDINISDLKPKQIVDAFKGMRNLNNGKMLSKSRMYKFLGRLSRAFNIAARQGVFMKNFEDAEAAIIGHIKENGKAPVVIMPYREDELKLLLEYVAPPKTEPYWVLPLIKMYLYTGKRFGEIQGLSNSKICHKSMTITIDCMISGRMYHDHLKSNGKPHVVIMDKELSEVVKELQAYNQKYYPGCEWLFPSRLFKSTSNLKGRHKCPLKGQPIQDSSIRKFTGIRMVRSGAGRKGIHNLRSTYATLRLIQLLREGNKLAYQIVQADLNHRNQKTTEIYLRIASEYLQDKNRTNVITSFLENTNVSNIQPSGQNIEGMMQMMGLNPEEINWDVFWEILGSVSKLGKKAA